MQHLTTMVENALSGVLDGFQAPRRLIESMNYSLLAGGKRLRPCLCLLCAGASAPPDARDAVRKAVLPFACALEMIHTYSLIHDDLPAMDDDDLRRGRPSNHKAFDEATAILAGDALLTDAFDMMTRCTDAGIPAGRVVRAISVAASAAGARGMVGGQVLDMACTGAAPDPTADADALRDRLRETQALKTGALFRAACVTGAILGGATAGRCDALAAYAEAFGLEFQIIDDVLDVTQDTATLGKPAGSDARHGKLTWPALVTREGAMERARAEAAKAVDALAGFSGPDADTLRDLATRLLTRVS